MIKPYKSVSKGNKKVYILASIEPSVEVTAGLAGASDFDAELISVLCSRVEAFV